MKTVYLCGPITGQSYDAARKGWRQDFDNRLADALAWTGRLRHIKCLSPMRGKDFLAGTTAPIDGSPNAYADLQEQIGSPRGVIGRDRNDVMNCDAVIACFLGCGPRISIGSMVEFGWADAFRKPIITIMEPDNIHNHVFVDHLSTYRVGDIPSAVDLVVHLLTPGL